MSSGEKITTPTEMTCGCGKKMRPVEFFYEAMVKGKLEQVPSCNAWFCADCGKTVLDKTPRNRGEFAAIIAANNIKVADAQ